MRSVILISYRQISAVRILLGLYFAYQFLAIIPFRNEMFGRESWFPLASSLLSWFSGPFQVALSSMGILAGLLFFTLISVLFAAGIYFRGIPVLMWWGVVSLVARNHFYFDFDFAYLGWLLMAFVLIPKTRAVGDSGSLIAVPGVVYWGAWLILGVSYTGSGVGKFLGGSWQEGNALSQLISNGIIKLPIAMNLSSTPIHLFLNGMTWFVLGAEMLFLPMIFLRQTRLIAWTAMTLIHIGIACTTKLTELSLACLIFHIFVFEAGWISWTRPALRRVT